MTGQIQGSGQRGGESRFGIGRFDAWNWNIHVRTKEARRVADFFQRNYDSTLVKIVSRT
jgi:hypothetical protein